MCFFDLMREWGKNPKGQHHGSRKLPRPTLIDIYHIWGFPFKGVV